MASSINTENSVNTTADEKLLIDSKDKSDSTKQQHLNKLKKKTNIIYIVIAILATALISIYSYYAVKLERDYNQSEEEWNIYYF